MSCVVFGASGSIGRHLLPMLHARGVAVLACSRHARDSGDSDGMQWMAGCLPARVPPLPPAVQAIVCLGPLDHFAEWLAQANVPGSPRIVAMSSMSAQSKQDSPDAAERELARRLRDSEQRLLRRCAQLGSACTLLRATLIYGAGTDRSLSRVAAWAMRWRVFPLPAGRGLRQPVHAADVALAVLAALDCPASAGCVVPVGGGERLSAAAMFARLRRSLPRYTLPLPLPRWLLRLAMVVSGRGRGMLARLDQDLVADNAKLVGLLGVQPRGFIPPGSPGEASR